MLKTWKNEFRTIWRAVPGNRFYGRYRRVRRRKGHDEMAPRVLRLMLAIVCLSIGVVMVPLPVPATPFLLLGGALLATESSSLARSLDRVELAIRKIFQGFRSSWRKLPFLGKGAIAALGASVIAGQIYFVCHVCGG